MITAGGCNLLRSTAGEAARAGSSLSFGAGWGEPFGAGRGEASTTLSPRPHHCETVDAHGASGYAEADADRVAAPDWV